MKRFIIHENLRLFRERLAAEKDKAAQETISKLIADEEAKLLEFEGDGRQTASASPDRHQAIPPERDVR